jgi:hypothetical protein
MTSRPLPERLLAGKTEILHHVEQLEKQILPLEERIVKALEGRS